jgi:hypothetical protein
MREVSVRQYVQDLRDAVLFQVVFIDRNVLTAKITNIKSIEFVKRGNSFLINLHFLLGKLGARQHFRVYSDLQTKNLFHQRQRSKQDRVCIRHVPQVIWHLVIFSTNS